MKIKNFRSFKEMVNISFQMPENTKIDVARRFEINTKQGNIRVLKNAFIFGGNASGKSNIFKAFLFFSGMILQPTMSDVQGLPVDTFARNQENTRFEIKFIKNNSVYIYTLEYKKTEIVFEKLTKDDVVVIERKGQDFITMPDLLSDTRFLKTIRPTTTALFFAQSNNDAISKEAFSWFYDVRYGNKENLALKIKEDNDFKEKILYALKFADFNVVDIEIEEVLRPSRGLNIKQVNEEIQSVEPVTEFPKILQVFLVHENQGNKYKIHLNNESLGTIQYFNFIMAVFNAQHKHEHLILSDEFGQSLHKKLAESIVNLLNSDNNHIQFIGITHNSEMMNLLKKHQIYFVEKNNAGESEIFKLSDFEEDKTRKDANYSKKYENELYGASQVVNEAGLLALLGENNA
ncbi:AAA family ATPase [Lactococcus hodotermopsidis]|nr:ATP-binding protein [Lactococcus hodotermopsidis]